LSLTLDDRAAVPPEEAYRHLLTWKGAHFARQRQARSWRSRPELASLYAELETVARGLGRWSAQMPAAADRTGWRELSALLARRDELEVDLAGRVAKLRAVSRAARPEVARLQEALPVDAALIDFFYFIPWYGDRRQHQNLLAFVV